MMKNKKNLITLLSILLIVLLGVTVYLYRDLFFNNKQEEVVEVKQEIVTEGIDPNRQLWLANKAINDDYIGEVVFESGLINKSFVQAKDVYDKDGNLYHFYTENGNLVSDPTGYNGNDVYIYTNWKDMSYDYNILGGSVFMDERNEIGDQNIIIYGHHFSNPKNDPDKVKAFTPLEKLLKQEYYEDNKIVKLILDNETRTYEFAGVYIFDVDDNYDLNYLQYYRTEYNYDSFNDIVDTNYYQSYIDAFNDSKLYDTDVSLTTDDKTLTLQTCIGGYNGEKLQICVYKLIDTVYYGSDQ